MSKKDNLSDVESIVEDQIRLLTVQSFDAGEQFNTIADRRDIQEQKMKLLDEKQRIEQAQRMA